MHNHVGYRWIKAFLSKFIRIIICLTLVYTPFFAHASAAEKWTIEEVVYNDVSKTLSYKAEKNYGPAANDYKYKIKVPVTSAAAGSTALSMIRMGVAGAAIYGLVEGVGWIIDNGVVKKPTEHNPQTIPNTQYYFQVQVVSGQRLNFDSETSARSYITNYAKSKGYTNEKGYTEVTIPEPFSINGSYSGIQSGSGLTYSFTKRKNGFSSFSFYYWIIRNTKYDPNIKPDSVTVSPEEMGDLIINSPSAPQILPDIYSPNNPVPRPSPAPDAVDKGLENAPPIPKENPKGDTQQKPNEDTDGDGEPDVFNPEKPSVGTEFTLPEFCSWAVTVCEWYTKYNANDDLDTDNEPPEIKEIDIDALDTSTFTGTAGCPAPIVVPISFGDGGETEISYEPICQLAEKWSFVAPLIGFLSGAMIIVGVGRKGEDGEI